VTNDQNSIETFLGVAKNERLESVVDYSRRGRRFEGHPVEELNARLVDLWRELVTEQYLSQADYLEVTDIHAELLLRGCEPQFPPALKKSIDDRTRKLLVQLTDDPKMRGNFANALSRYLTRKGDASGKPN
jgi:hypothetical protein